MNDMERALKAPGRRLGALAIGLLALTSLLAWLALSPGARSAVVDLFDLPDAELERAGPADAGGRPGDDGDLPFEAPHGRRR